MLKKLALALLSVCCLAAPAQAETTAKPENLYDKQVYKAAVEQAREKKLAQNPYWETLMHYKKGWFSGYRSLIDDERFFLAPDGKYNAQAELEANIAGILSQDKTPDVHAQCRFPARAQWLEEEIPALQGQLPQAACPRYDEILRRIDPTKATLVFPFFNMDGPSSIFGHTMLRLERDNSASLLGYAVTYAAAADGSSSIGYIFKGLFGGFDGVYSVLPYAQKLNEYSSMESRDVWEYELNLNPDEVMRMYKHVWEASMVAADYYFMDENCAYNLLFFFEAARPGVLLTDGYVSVLPADTIKAISTGDLVKRINFRPSNVKLMQAMADTLSSSELSTAKKIANGKIPASAVRGMDISESRQAAMLDLSGELLRFYNTSVKSDAQHEQFRRLSIEILGERAKISAHNSYYVEPPAVSPEQGHGTDRLKLDAGYAFDSPYVQLGYRPFYHSLEDNAAGFLEGSNSTIADVRLRYYTDSDRFGLERLTLIGMHNLLPFTALYTPTSWISALGIDDRSVDADHSFRVAYGHVARGITLELGKSAFVWAMAGVEAQYQMKSPYELTAGGGLEAGFSLNTGSIGKLLLEAKGMRFVDHSEHYEVDLSAQYSVYPAKNHAISAKARYLRMYKRDGTDFGLSYSFHF